MAAQGTRRVIVRRKRIVRKRVLSLQATAGSILLSDAPVFVTDVEAAKRALEQKYTTLLRADPQDGNALAQCVVDYIEVSSMDSLSAGSGFVAPSGGELAGFSPVDLHRKAASHFAADSAEHHEQLALAYALENSHQEAEKAFGKAVAVLDGRRSALDTSSSAYGDLCLQILDLQLQRQAAYHAANTAGQWNYLETQILEEYKRIGRNYSSQAGALTDVTSLEKATLYMQAGEFLQEAQSLATRGRHAELPGLMRASFKSAVVESLQCAASVTTLSAAEKAALYDQAVRADQQVKAFGGAGSSVELIKAAYIGAGDNYGVVGNFALAAERYAQAIALVPAVEGADLTALYEKFVAQYALAARQNPASVAAHRALALEAYVALIASGQTTRSNYEGAGDCYAAQGNYNGALAQYTNAVALASGAEKTPLLTKCIEQQLAVAPTEYLAVAKLYGQALDVAVDGDKKQSLSFNLLMQLSQLPQPIDSHNNQDFLRLFQQASTYIGDLDPSTQAELLHQAALAAVPEKGQETLVSNLLSQSVEQCKLALTAIDSASTEARSLYAKAGEIFSLAAQHAAAREQGALHQQAADYYKGAAAQLPEDDAHKIEYARLAAEQSALAYVGRDQYFEAAQALVKLRDFRGATDAYNAAAFAAGRDSNKKAILLESINELETQLAKIQSAMTTIRGNTAAASEEKKQAFQAVSKSEIELLKLLVGQYQKAAEIADLTAQQELNRKQASAYQKLASILYVVASAPSVAVESAVAPIGPSAEAVDVAVAPAPSAPPFSVDELRMPETLHLSAADYSAEAARLFAASGDSAAAVSVYSHAATHETNPARRASFHSEWGTLLEAQAQIVPPPASSSVSAVGVTITPTMTATVAHQQAALNYLQAIVGGDAVTTATATAETALSGMAEAVGNDTAKSALLQQAAQAFEKVGTAESYGHAGKSYAILAEVGSIAPAEKAKHHEQAAKLYAAVGNVDQCQAQLFAAHKALSQLPADQSARPVTQVCADGNCFFYSVTLGYLQPERNNPVEFAVRAKKLLGDAITPQDIQALQAYVNHPEQYQQTSAFSGASAAPHGVRIAVLIQQLRVRVHGHATTLAGSAVAGSSIHSAFAIAGEASEHLAQIAQPTVSVVAATALVVGNMLGVGVAVESTAAHAGVLAGGEPTVITLRFAAADGGGGIPNHFDLVQAALPAANVYQAEHLAEYAAVAGTTPVVVRQLQTAAAVAYEANADGAVRRAAEAAALRAGLGEYTAAAPLYVEASDHRAAAESYLAAGKVEDAAKQYGVAAEHEADPAKKLELLKQSITLLDGSIAQAKAELAAAQTALKSKPLEDEVKKQNAVLLAIQKEFQLLELSVLQHEAIVAATTDPTKKAELAAANVALAGQYEVCAVNRAALQTFATKNPGVVATKNPGVVAAKILASPSVDSTVDSTKEAKEAEKEYHQKAAGAYKKAAELFKAIGDTTNAAAQFKAAGGVLVKTADLLKSDVAPAAVVSAAAAAPKPTEADLRWDAAKAYAAGGDNAQANAQYKAAAPLLSAAADAALANLETQADLFRKAATASAACGEPAAAIALHTRSARAYQAALLVSGVDPEKTTRLNLRCAQAFEGANLGAQALPHYVAAAQALANPAPSAAGAVDPVAVAAGEAKRIRQSVEAFAAAAKLDANPDTRLAHHQQALVQYQKAIKLEKDPTRLTVLRQAAAVASVGEAEGHKAAKNYKQAAEAYQAAVGFSADPKEKKKYFAASMAESSVIVAGYRATATTTGPDSGAKMQAVQAGAQVIVDQLQRYDHALKSAEAKAEHAEAGLYAAGMAQLYVNNHQDELARKAYQKAAECFGKAGKDFAVEAVEARLKQAEMTAYTQGNVKALAVLGDVDPNKIADVNRKYEIVLQKALQMHAVTPEVKPEERLKALMVAVKAVPADYVASEGLTVSPQAQAWALIAEQHHEAYKIFKATQGQGAPGTATTAVADAGLSGTSADHAKKDLEEALTQATDALRSRIDIAALPDDEALAKLSTEDRVTAAKLCLMRAELNEPADSKKDWLVKADQITKSFNSSTEHSAEKRIAIAELFLQRAKLQDPGEEKEAFLLKAGDWLEPIYEDREILGARHLKKLKEMYLDLEQESSNEFFQQLMLRKAKEVPWAANKEGIRSKLDDINEAIKTNATPDTLKLCNGFLDRHDLTKRERAEGMLAKADCLEKLGDTATWRNGHAMSIHERLDYQAELAEMAIKNLNLKDPNDFGLYMHAQQKLMNVYHAQLPLSAPSLSKSFWSPSGIGFGDITAWLGWKPAKNLTGAITRTTEQLKKQLASLSKSGQKPLTSEQVAQFSASVEAMQAFRRTVATTAGFERSPELRQLDAMLTQAKTQLTTTIAPAITAQEAAKRALGGVAPVMGACRRQLDEEAKTTAKAERYLANPGMVM